MGVAFGPPSRWTWSVTVGSVGTRLAFGAFAKGLCFDFDFEDT